MTIDELRARLCEIHARIGFEGRFSFTIDQRPEGGCYVTHWFRPSEFSYEDCKAVGAGTVDECLAALERYAETYRRRDALDAVGSVPGHRYGTAAE